MKLAIVLLVMLAITEFTLCKKLSKKRHLKRYSSNKSKKLRTEINVGRSSLEQLNLEGEDSGKTVKKQLKLEGDASSKEQLKLEGEDSSHEKLKLEGDATSKEQLKFEGNDDSKEQLKLEGEDSSHEKLKLEGEDSSHEKLKLEGEDSSHEKLKLEGEDNSHEKLKLEGEDSSHEKLKLEGHDSSNETPAKLKLEGEDSSNETPAKLKYENDGDSVNEVQKPNSQKQLKLKPLIRQKSKVCILNSKMEYCKEGKELPDQPKSSSERLLPIYWYHPMYWNNKKSHKKKSI